MHALLVKAVPTRAKASLAEARAVGRTIVVQDVVLTGNVKHLSRPAVLQHLLEAVELIVLGQMGEVPGVDQEFGRHKHRVDP
jgi:hypothetical protein